MIVDRLANATFYFAIHPLLERGFRFLLETDLTALPPGKHEIEGDRLFALVQEYETIPAEQGRWERHRSYADIQYMESGSERMGYTNVEGLSEIEAYPEKDLWFLDAGAAGDAVLVPEGSFAVFLPHDAHRPMLAAESPARVRKIVVKAKIG